jgi:hypothetical protein
MLQITQKITYTEESTFEIILIIFAMAKTASFDDNKSLN